MKASTLLFLSAFALSAQTQPALDFDAASVKIDNSGSGHTGIDRDGGLLRMTGVTLRACIAWAYKVTAPQINGPDWIDTDKYDIVAKIAFDDKQGQINVRLQRLLADRFKLTLHRETKESSVLALTVDKNGPKIKEDEPDSTGDDMSSKRGHLDAKRVTMARLADFLASPRAGLEVPVVNATGITGVYSFSLDWTPESPNGRPAKESADAPPPLLTALQEQLGLKLVSRKAPVEHLMIDHAERVPTEN